MQSEHVTGDVLAVADNLQSNTNRVVGDEKGIQCPYCCEQIKFATKKCPHCQEFISRKMSFGLILGVLLLPLIFAWFVMRNGYSKRARIIVFTYLIVTSFLVFYNSIDTPSTIY